MSETVLPGRSPRLLCWFLRYVRRYLRKNFHAVRLARCGPPVDPGGPLIVVLNHPSWWDPLVGLLLTELFPSRTAYCPIESAALARYRFFERLGFFSIVPGTTLGAMTFLRTATSLLNNPRSALWVTAQGRFSDVRQRPLELQPGVAHLVRRLAGGAILPLALEYPFWNERYPEALACFGRPIPIGRGSERTVEDWQAHITAGLSEAQDALTLSSLTRDPAHFVTLVGGSTGVGGLYDLWRRFRACVRGERFDTAHDAVPAEGVR